MKYRKNMLSGALALLVCLGLFTGCTKEETPPEAAASTPPAEQVQETTPAVESTQPAEQEETTAPAGPREITDMAGRTVTLPAEMKTVYSSGPVAAIYLYTLVPDMLLGWNYEHNDIEKSVILEKYHDLPNFGMGDAVNYEAVIAAAPSVAVSVGTINDKMTSDCDKLSESLGIPVIAVDGDLENAPAAYRFMGEVFGVEEQAEKLAAYAEKTFSDLENMDIPDDQKVRVYYGNGEDTLNTAPAGSRHGQIIDMVKAINVADLELGDGSRVQISPEQLLAWDPDVIIVNGEPKSNLSGNSASEKLMNDPTYADLKAVQELKVYGTPNAPFSWVDRPPGPNRIVGIRWMSGLLYPDYLNFDVDEEVREFYSLFYHVDLTDEQLEKLYKGEI